MAEFSDKIISAVFVNEEHTIIKIRYEDNGVISIFNVEVDESDADFKALLDEGWDLQRVTDETVEAKKAESHAFNLMVNQAAEKILEETRHTREKKINEELQYKEEKLQELEKNLEQYFDKITNDKDKDTLFRFKLWALETKEVKESTKELKSKLRKAKNIVEGFAILHEVRILK